MTTELAEEEIEEILRWAHLVANEGQFDPKFESLYDRIYSLYEEVKTMRKAYEES